MKRGGRIAPPPSAYASQKPITDRVNKKNKILQYKRYTMKIVIVMAVIIVIYILFVVIYSGYAIGRYAQRLQIEI